MRPIGRGLMPFQAVAGGRVPARKKVHARSNRRNSRPIRKGCSSTGAGWIEQQTPSYFRTEQRFVLMEKRETKKQV